MTTNNVLEFVREDDFVEYFLFPQLIITDNNVECEENELNKTLVEINGIANVFCQDYIWHKDEFKVIPKFKNSNLLIDDNQSKEHENLPPHLYGITHYGDNIQDEWFIVALLYELSRKIPGLIVRIIDSDGEFLLIEAANSLPKWANPDTCEQRVYIADGHIHLVQNSPSNTSSLLAVTDAVAKIRSNPNLYKVSPDIQACIDERIKDYPAKITEDLHRTIAYVPFGVAALVRQKPSLISSAVRSFCNRDPIDMKACRAMRYFPPENRVYTSVVFTRCLYAMLTHNNYVPDRRTGWNLPASSSATYKAHSLGVKLACGFEILASQAKPSLDLENDKGWNVYRERLKERGYFQGFLEGSRDYMKLMDVAKEYYRVNEESMKCAPSIGQEIIDDLKNSEYTVDDFTQDETTLPPSDDESWLNISPEELDQMLMKRYGIKNVFVTNGNEIELTEKLSEFLDRKSEFDGIDYPTDDGETTEVAEAPVKPKRGVKKAKPKIQFMANEKSENDSPAGGNQIDFDPDAFGSQVKNLLDLIIPEDNWDSNSEMSDYEDDDDIEKNIEEMANVKTIPQTSLKKYMDQMDRELAKTTIGKSFESKPSTGDDSFDDIECFTPVDIDVNTLKNMMESYQSQLGGPGPASTLLNSMGLRIKGPNVNENNSTEPQDT